MAANRSAIKNLDDLLGRLRELWASDREAYDACVRIVDFLQAGGKDSSYITFFDLRGRDESNSDSLRKATECLTGSELPILALRFQLIEPDEDEETADRTVFTPADVNEMRHKDRLVNPLTGEEDPALLSKLFVFFEPTPLAKQLFESQRR
jgi:hypothetical protein